MSGNIIMKKIIIGGIFFASTIAAYSETSDEMRKNDTIGYEFVNSKPICNEDIFMKITKEFDVEKTAKNQSKLFYSLINQLKSGNPEKAMLKARRHYELNYRGSYQHTYSSKKNKESNDFLKKMVLLVDFIATQSEALQISEADYDGLLPLLILNQDVWERAVQHAVRLEIYGPSTSEKAIEIMAEDKKHGLYVALSKKKPLEILKKLESMGCASKAFPMVRTAFDSMDGDKLAAKALMAHGFSHQEFLFRKVIHGKTPAEIKKNLPNLLLEDGSFYDELLNDFASIDHNNNQ